MKKIVLALFLLTLTLFIFSSCNMKKEEISGFSMDAPYSIKITKANSDEINKVKKFMKSPDKLFDAYSEDSYLYKLNIDKKIKLTEDDKELFDIIKKTYPYCNNAFDISIRNVSKLWDFNSDKPHVPEKEKIENALKTVSFKNISITDDEIILKNNCSVELGAVAKGCCADRVFDILKNSEAVIDMGGTIISSVKKDINVGIRNPMGDGMLCSFKMGYGKAASTSGSYERYFYENNKKYHHILNPKTGYCAESDLVSVTVVSESALKSDILSTMYFVEGKDSFTKYNNVSVLFVTKDKKVYIKGNIIPENLNEEYTLIR